MYYLKGIGYFGSLNNALGLGDLAAVKTYKQAEEYAKAAIKVVEKEILELPENSNLLGSYVTAKQRYENALAMTRARHRLEQVIQELEAADRYYDEVIGQGKVEPAWGVDPKTNQPVTPASATVAPAGPGTVAQAPIKVKSKELRRNPWLWASLGVGAFTLLALLWMNQKRKKNPWAAVLPRGSYIYDKPAEALRKSLELQRKGERARFSKFPFTEETHRWMREHERKS